MKVFQILNEFCHWDATQLYPTLADIPADAYPAEVVFVQTPDYVFEGWGYDAQAEGDERFIQPIPPEGWIYDPGTGTFYPEDTEPTEPNPIDAALEEMGVQVYEAAE